MNKKGFTLIELLAVIIILGILMIIAIPSVTRYISDSRKSAYVDTAKEITSGARNIVNAGNLEMYDTNVTYYIDSSCIQTENASKSPYGDFLKAYVVVTYDGKGYSYYWTSVDETGQGVKNIVKIDKLVEDHIESDLNDSDITTLRGIDGRDKTIVVSEQNNCQKEVSNDATSQINGETGEVEKRASIIIKRTASKAGQLASVGDDIYIFKGENPNNYVRFNGETWRVLGIYGDKIKIIRKVSISPPGYKADYNDTNTWSTSYVKSNLNNTFYNSLSDDAKTMISGGTWYIGSSTTSATAIEAYANAKQSIDTCNVGLIATYEFLYASDGPGCDNVQGKTGIFESVCGNRSHNWLTSNDLWTVTTQKNSSSHILYVHAYGFVHSNYGGGFNSYPTVYLKPQVEIVSGNGTSSNPYQFEYNNE